MLTRGRWAWLALGGLWLGACRTDVIVIDNNAFAGMSVSPNALLLDPIHVERCTTPGCTDVCEDFTCCGTVLDPAGQVFIPSEASGDVLRARCCRHFEVGLTGGDVVVGARWLPGDGSTVDLIATQSLPLPTSRDEATPLRGCYRMPVRGPEPCHDTDPGAGPPSPTCETGLPADDGVLRFFFQQDPSVDLYVEVR